MAKPSTTAGYEEDTSEGARRRDESEEERLDRNLVELLQELRVAIPGIQVLFAFLLILPFQQRWPEVTDFERGVYYATLLSTAAASVFLMAPSARHRLRFGELDKRWIVETANRLAIVGLALLGISMTGAILLVSHFVYGDIAAALATAGIFGAFLIFWFVVPLLRRFRADG